MSDAEGPLSLATIPLDQIDYAVIRQFCERQLEEDIDLDYKSELPSDIGKAICAFANSQGGVLLLGIAEEGKTRQPICPPAGFPCDPDAIRQQILNIAFEAIYPPVEPEVKVIPVPDSENHVVLVRIEPSTLLHAADRRSRIYVRSMDNNRGYALASLPVLQWLWDRRASSTSLRNQLYESALERSHRPAVPFPEGYGSKDWSSSPHLRVSSLPMYPRSTVLAEPRQLIDIANSLGTVRSTWKRVDRQIPWNENQWRPITSGVCLRDRGLAYAAQYAELGSRGEVFTDFLLHKQPVRELLVPRNTSEHCIYSYIVLSSLDICLQFTASFYQALKFRQPVILSAVLTGVSGLLLHFHWPSSPNYLAEERLSQACPDEEVDLLSSEHSSSDLAEQVAPLLFRGAKSLAWAFGLSWTEDQVSTWLESHQ